MTEKELEELKKNTQSAACFLGIIGGSVLYGYDIISGAWTIPVILVLSGILIGVFHAIIKKNQDEPAKMDK